VKIIENVFVFNLQADMELHGSGFLKGMPTFKYSPNVIKYSNRTNCYLKITL